MSGTTTSTPVDAGRAARCPRSEIDTHFYARLSPPRERAMRDHVADCAGCRAYYERHLLLSRIDPTARSGRDRLALGLGLAPVLGRGRAPARRWWAAALAALALGAVLLVLRPSGSSDFHARGGPAALESSLAVYRLAGGRSTPLADRGDLARADELAFAYRNPEGYARLLVYGVDEHGHVYWYFPAWLDAAADPEGVALASGPQLREIGEAVRHRLDGARLRVVGLFTNRRLTVREVEARLAKLGVDAPADPGDRQIQVELAVRGDTRR